MSRTETTTIGVSIGESNDLVISHWIWNDSKEINNKIYQSLQKIFVSKVDFENYFTQKIIDNLFRSQKFLSFIGDQDCISGTCPCSDAPIQLKSGDLFIWEDYVTNPMIWCDKCGRRSFICISCKPELKKSKDGKCLEYTYPLMNVIGVRNYQLYDWKWSKETFAKYFDEFLKIDGYSDSDAQREFCQERGIERMNEDDNVFYDENDIQDWTCYVSCNSTNAEDVIKPIDMAHDGIYIYCLCECKKCGIKFEGCYWGD